MLKKKLKKHGFADRLKYMRLLESGRSFTSINKEFGINKEQLQVLWDKYQMYGELGLQKSKYTKRDFALKKKIVLEIEKNHLPLRAASLKYDVCPQKVYLWVRLYRENGWTALKSIKKRGRPPIMGRPKKNSKPLTELERLRKEVQELRTENALLKKVRALVEERNARLRAIGQEPSKN